MSVNTCTNYEQGVRPLSLEQAWEFADALDCTLDELAGRKRPRKTLAENRGKGRSTHNVQSGRNPVRHAAERTQAQQRTSDHDVRGDAHADRRDRRIWRRMHRKDHMIGLYLGLRPEERYGLTLRKAKRRRPPQGNGCCSVAIHALHLPIIVLQCVTSN